MMVHALNMRAFARMNHDDLVRIVTSICSSYPNAPVEDLVQEVYLKIQAKKILRKYDRKRAKFSTYLYQIIKNLILNYRKDPENIIENHRLRMEYVDIQDHNEDSGGSDYINDVVTAFNPYRHKDPEIDVNYLSYIHSNYISDSMDGINFDLNLFEHLLERKNKTYSLRNRRDKTVTRTDLSLLIVFQHMRDGYTNYQIARKFGVSNMFVTFLKNKIRDRMEKFGILWGVQKSKALKKKALTRK